MYRLYVIVIILITATCAQAQINEVNLLSNPILEKHQAEKKQQIQTMLQKRRSTMHVAAATRDVFTFNGTCLASGNTRLICSDTLGLGAASTVMLLTESVLNFGTATLDTNCVFYVADGGVSFGIDSIYVEVCSSNTGVCDTSVYPIYVHRANDEIINPTTEVNAEDTVTICVDVTNLPNDLSSVEIISNNNILGDAFPLGSCIFYEANRFAGVDTVVYEICDDFCVCDTYKIPISIAQDTLELPFMDDFSYDGPFPNDNWLTKSVFINNTMAIAPVSVGVATFDGLNEGGAPHGGGYGVSDNLTSAYLNLAPFSAASNVYLSFYVQPQGLGEAPAGVDSLILEFKNLIGEWVLIDTFKYENLPKDEFTFFSYYINESQYHFKGFQFRFRNFSLRSGNIDHWHIDYVRLRNNGSDSPFLADIAFTQNPNSILRNYTSMPWWHFTANVDGEIPTPQDFLRANFYNHQDNENTAEDSELFLYELETGQVILPSLVLLDGTEANIPFGSTNLSNLIITGSAFPTFQNAMNNDFPDDAKFLEFEKEYTFTVGEENPNVNPIVERNNVVTSTTIFDNYFAYDDGTAESGLEATKRDVQIALKYTANVADTLKAIQIHFPHIRENTSDQLFNLRVWVGALDDTPEYDGILKRPLYIDSYQDSLNGFTTYVLDDIISGERTPLAIPPGDFYVGWKQISECQVNECIAVGMDKNHPDGTEDIFFDAFGFGLDWKSVATENPTIIGSLMMRPVLGEGEPMQSSQTEDVTKNTRIDIFPNPTSGYVNVNIENGTIDQFSYFLFDAVGKIVQRNDLSDQLDLTDLQNGIYFLKIVNNKTQEIFNHKIILTQ